MLTGKSKEGLNSNKIIILLRTVIVEFYDKF